MSAKDTFENMAKNTWLAGLGSFESSKELIEKSIGAAQEKTNCLFSELQSRGEKIQSTISETREDLEIRARQLFGIPSGQQNDEKLAELNAKLDALTTAVVGLIEKRNAEKVAAKPSRKPRVTRTAKKSDTPKSSSAAKTTAKVKTGSATKTTTRAKSASKTSSGAKTTTKPIVSSDSKTESEDNKSK